MSNEMNEEIMSDEMMKFLEDGFDSLAPSSHVLNNILGSLATIPVIESEAELFAALNGGSGEGAMAGAEASADAAVTDSAAGASASAGSGAAAGTSASAGSGAAAGSKGSGKILSMRGKKILFSAIGAVAVAAAAFAAYISANKPVVGVVVAEPNNLGTIFIDVQDCIAISYDENYQLTDVKTKDESAEAIVAKIDEQTSSGMPVLDAVDTALAVMISEETSSDGSQMTGLISCMTYTASATAVTEASMSQEDFETELFTHVETIEDTENDVEVTLFYQSFDEDDDIAAGSEEQGISPGKYYFIQKVAENYSVDVTEYSKYSTDEIVTYLKDQGIDIKADENFMVIKDTVMKVIEENSSLLPTPAASEASAVESSSAESSSASESSSTAESSTAASSSDSAASTSAYNGSSQAAESSSANSYESAPAESMDVIDQSSSETMKSTEVETSLLDDYNASTADTVAVTESETIDVTSSSELVDASEGEDEDPTDEGQTDPANEREDRGHHRDDDNWWMKHLK